MSKQQIKSERQQRLDFPSRQTCMQTREGLSPNCRYHLFAMSTPEEIRNMSPFCVRTLNMLCLTVESHSHEPKMSVHETQMKICIPCVRKRSVATYTYTVRNLQDVCMCMPIPFILLVLYSPWSIKLEEPKWVGRIVNGPAKIIRRENDGSARDRPDLEDLLGRRHLYGYSQPQPQPQPQQNAPASAHCHCRRPVDLSLTVTLPFP
jgi:hypothetical protein